MRTLVPIFAALTLVAMAACGSNDNPVVDGGSPLACTASETAGVSGKSCWTWAHETMPGEPIGVGASDSLQIRSTALVAADASSASTLATFSLTQASSAGADDVSTVAIQARAVGAPQLILSDASGLEIDRISLSVEDVSETSAYSPLQAFAAFVGAPLELSVATYNAASGDLAGEGGVTFSATGNAVALAAVPGEYGDVQWFKGSAVGAGAVDVSASDLSVAPALQLDFVDPSSITALTLSAGTVTTANSAGSVVVGVSAMDGTNLVFGQACAWTTSSASVQLVTADASTFDSTATAPTVGETATFAISQHGSYTATCTIGAQSQMVAIDWP